MKVGSIFLILMIAAGVDGQQYKLGLPGVSPLKTSRISFEKIYGQPVVKNPENRVFKYRTDNLSIEVTYTGKPCSEGIRGEYRVRQNTLLYYTVFYRKPVKISDVKFDINRFAKDESGDLLNHFQYINLDEGVTIRAYVPGGDNNTYVNGIKYYPSLKEEAHRKCSKGK